ncbi:helix-turn-helix domain-containing protein [Kribbella sp.]|uniref:helix-turn-helix domain-containing protein n=1 Tax=Kribbella sp. TaxID=1871183 RepID=UPI002D6FC73E|nr:helix-turn-helix domain-containing protein [Kribbella sp.]HZX07120.1 helix-turn-helix domain-containing protein [Kribbella sp.]
MRQPPAGYGGTSVEDVLVPTANPVRAGLEGVLDDIGTTLLDVVCGDPGRADDLGGVVIHDPLDDQVLPRQALVLGVGLHDPADLVRVVGEVGRHGAAALVVRAPVVADEELVAAAERTGVVVLALARGASWTQLTSMVRSLIAGGHPGALEALGGIPAGDLFALANAIAALLDAPITIEDPSTRVLAFSGRQEAADPSRVQTILSRQVPREYTRILRERGVFQEIFRTDQPVFVAPLPEYGELPRVAIAVRAGDEILGTIWAAVTEPLPPDRGQALCDAAKQVALYMIRQRAGADVERRLRADLLRTALESGPGSGEAIRRLGLADEPAVVLAVGLLDADGGSGSGTASRAGGGGDGRAGAEVLGRTAAELVAERKRLADAFGMHLAAVHPRSAAGLIGEVAYGVVPLPRTRPDADARPDAEDRAVRIATDFLGRIGPRLRPLVGIGSPVVDGSALSRSRTGADRALRVLRSRGSTQQVARVADVYVEALLLELADLVPRDDLSSGPVARLAAYDAKHRSLLVDTLRAWLDAFGDVAVASAAMYVHTNTFRYRLRRVAEVGGIDLDDPDVRFAMMLQLRLMTLTSR